MNTFGPDRPIFPLLAATVALLIASFGWAWLARRALAASWRRPFTGELLAGCAACGPLLLLAIAQALLVVPTDVAPISVGAALTYMLLPPAILLHRCRPAAWAAWRRAVLPFLLAASVMWLLIATSGGFGWLKGQFLITLFTLGTWLFSLDRTDAPIEAHPDGSPPAEIPTAYPRQRSAEHPDAATQTLSPGTHAAAALADRSASLWPAMLLTVLVLLATIVTSALAVVPFIAPTLGPPVWLMPLFGGLICTGPLVFARSTSPDRSNSWLSALGYAAMVAYCLVPGLGIFAPAASSSLMMDLTSTPLYVADVAFAATAAAFLLGVDAPALQPGRPLRRIILAAYVLWICWILFNGMVR